MQEPTTDTPAEITETPPQTPEGYEIPVDSEVPFDPKTDLAFKTLAHSLKLTNSQVKAIGEWANTTGRESLSESSRQRQIFKEASIKSLQDEWGPALETNLTKAVLTAERLAGSFPEFKEFLNDTGVGDDPRLIRTMLKIGEMISEDSLPSSTGRLGGGTDHIGSIPLLSFKSMK